MRVSRYTLAVLVAGLMLMLALAGCGGESSRPAAADAAAPDSGSEAATTSNDYSYSNPYSNSSDTASDSEAENPEPSEDDPATDDSDPAYQLAVIDGNDAPTVGDVAVYAIALKRLQKKCKNTRT